MVMLLSDIHQVITELSPSLAKRHCSLQSYSRALSYRKDCLTNPNSSADHRVLEGRNISEPKFSF